MRTLKSLSIVLSLIIYSNILLAETAVTNSAVKATVDRNPVRVNETFELTIHLKTAPVNKPELVGLPVELEVQRSSNFYKRSSFNGESSVQAGWHFTIKATREGIYTIPSFDIDGSKTQAVSLKVLEAVSSTNVNGQDDAIKLEVETDSDSIYVQQQLNYTIRLYRAVQAQYASMTEPELEGALIERVGEDAQFETSINSVRYVVLERKYAIYPQQSGSFVIKPVTFNAEISTGNRSFSTLGSLRNRSKTVTLSSDEKRINVKPIPAEVSGWWLPASELSLQQSWLPETDALEVGSPATWTYTLLAKGLTSTQLPDIKPEQIPGLKFYPEKASSDNNIVNDSLVGSRTQKIAVIPTKAGKITIPEITIPWWNVDTNKAEVLTIPAKTINISGTDASTINQPKVPEVKQTTAIEPNLLTTEDSKLQSTDSESQDVIIWQITTALAVFLWLFTLLIKRNAATPNNHSPKQSKQEVKNSASFKDVEKAISKSNAAEISQAIINYARGQYTQGLSNQINSLGDIIKLTQSDRLKEQLIALDRALYSQNGAEQWNPKQLSSAIKELTDLTPFSSSKTADNPTQLPPLHPK